MRRSRLSPCPQTGGIVGPPPCRCETGKGTVYGTGMMGDIFYKNADITVAPLGVTFERGSFVDFLPTVKHYYMELYISKDSQEHAIDFHLLLSPFAQDSWILIIFASLIIALVKLAILRLHGNICRL